MTADRAALVERLRVIELALATRTYAFDDGPEDAADTVGAAIAALQASAQRDEQRDEVHKAAAMLYLTGRWECKELTPVEQAQAWERLRDALDLPPGTATALGVAAPRSEAPAPEAVDGLRPCPFCGGRAMHTVGSAKPPGHYVMCVNPDCNIATAMRALAADAAQDWNRRATPPAAVDERRDAEDTQRLIDRMSDLLTRTANALKGPPEALHLHSWHDLPEVAAAIKAGKP